MNCYCDIITVQTRLSVKTTRIAQNKEDGHFSLLVRSMYHGVVSIKLAKTATHTNSLGTTSSKLQQTSLTSSFYYKTMCWFALKVLEMVFWSRERSASSASSRDAKLG